MSRWMPVTWPFALGALCLIVVAVGGVLTGYAANTHTIAAGAESSDMAVQIYDFIPKPVTVNVGDTVTWRVDSTEFHTVTFLGGAPRPGFFEPSELGLVMHPLAAFPTGESSYDGSGVRSSALLQKGDTYNLTFTSAGTYDYVCIVHVNMQGQIVVREAGAPTDAPAATEAKITPHVNNDLAARGLPLIVQHATENTSPTAAGDIAAGVTAGAGDQHVALHRFLPGNVTIHNGEAVTWVNRDPDTPHTVTLLAGEEPPDIVTPVSTGDGPPALVLNPRVLMPQGSESFDGAALTSSGMIGGPENPGTISYSLRFSQPGVFQYICLLHEEMGMRGTVTVLP